MSAPWSLEDDGLLVRLWSSGQEPHGMAKVLKREAKDVANRLHEHGLTVPLPFDADLDYGSASSQAKRIIAEVAALSGVREVSLIGRRRAKRIAHPRMVAMALLVNESRMSTPEVGRLFGGRDHTTVMHAMRRVSAEMETGGPLADIYRAALDSLYPKMEVAA